MPEVRRIDEFAFVLLAGVILIFILMVAWTTPTELPPYVEPTSVSLTAHKGTTKSFDLTINGTLTGVNLTASGEIKDWITFNKNNFDVDGKVKVTVTVKVPSTASLGYHNGRIIVSSTGGEKAVSVAVEVTEAAAKKLATRPIVLGDFEVSYTSGTETLDSKESVQVSKGYFSGHDINLVGIVSEEKLDIITSGYLQLIVDDTNTAGNLIVFFNGKKVFDKPVGIGEVLSLIHI